MTPGARLSAAIELLDAIIAGEPAERELTRWARTSRFAGSKDRAAVRDLVYDGLRRRRSLGWLGGGDSGRAIVLAHQAGEGADLDTLFTGQGFDPAPVTGAERAGLARDLADATEGVRLDFPDFLHDELAASLGRRLRAGAPGDADPRAGRPPGQPAEDQPRRRDRRARPRRRAGRAPPAGAAMRCASSTIPRLVAASRAYTSGMVELQDASSQVVAEMAAARPGMTVLDYCAGGGGKTLALAAAMQGEGRLLAWDVNPRRMADLPERARRAGATVRILTDDELRGAPAGLRPRACRRALLGHRRLAAQARGQVAADAGRARRLRAASGFHPRRRRRPG